MIRQFDSDGFLPLQTLVDRKGLLRQRISLVIPALNEEKTIRSIVTSARTELLDRIPLLDEIIVMDGGSADRTADVAREAGASVHQTASIFPHLNIPGGKGSSLWKSQFVTSGDILVYVDADILNFGPHFIYGLAGALLADEHLVCAKAFYRRPFVSGQTILEDQGGRVTEILVRPLLSAWYPPLARIGQPLGGEYAFRRSALMQMPFSSGYGVDIRLLITAFRKFGLESIAQVDMGRRLHRNRPLYELGRMSHAILLDFFRLLREDGKVSYAQPPSPLMMLPGGAVDGDGAQTDETVLPAAQTIGAA